MSRDKRYQRLLNSKRWRELRAAYLREHPLCERCQREGIAEGVLPYGYITPAIDVHHKTPVESALARSDREMEALCYDWHNLEALCIACHSRTHREMGKGSRQLHQQREQDRFERWKARMTRQDQQQHKT